MFIRTFTHKVTVIILKYCIVNATGCFIKRGIMLHLLAKYLKSNFLSLISKKLGSVPGM